MNSDAKDLQVNIPHEAQYFLRCEAEIALLELRQQRNGEKRGIEILRLETALREQSRDLIVLAFLLSQYLSAIGGLIDNSTWDFLDKFCALSLSPVKKLRQIKRRSPAPEQFQRNHEAEVARILEAFDIWRQLNLSNLRELSEIHWCEFPFTADGPSYKQALEILDSIPDETEKKFSTSQYRFRDPCEVINQATEFRLKEMTRELEQLVRWFEELHHHSRSILSRPSAKMLKLLARCCPFSHLQSVLNADSISIASWSQYTGWSIPARYRLVDAPDGYRRPETGPLEKFTWDEERLSAIQNSILAYTGWSYLQPMFEQLAKRDWQIRELPNSTKIFLNENELENLKPSHIYLADFFHWLVDKPDHDQHLSHLVSMLRMLKKGGTCIIWEASSWEIHFCESRLVSTHADTLKEDREKSFAHFFSLQLRPLIDVIVVREKSLLPTFTAMFSSAKRHVYYLPPFSPITTDFVNEAQTAHQPCPRHPTPQSAESLAIGVWQTELCTDQAPVSDGEALLANLPAELQSRITFIPMNRQQLSNTALEKAPGEIKLPLCSCSAVLVLPNRALSFAKIAHLLNYQVPLIVPAIGDMTRELIHGANAFIYEPDSKESLHSSLSKLLNTSVYTHLCYMTRARGDNLQKEDGLLQMERILSKERKQIFRKRGQ